jgi:hypothetical protein
MAVVKFARPRINNVSLMRTVVAEDDAALVSVARTIPLAEKTPNLVEGELLEVLLVVKAAESSGDEKYKNVTMTIIQANGTAALSSGLFEYEQQEFLTNIIFNL